MEVVEVVIGRPTVTSIVVGTMSVVVSVVDIGKSVVGSVDEIVVGTIVVGVSVVDIIFAGSVVDGITGKSVAISADGIIAEAAAEDIVVSVPVGIVVVVSVKIV